MGENVVERTEIHNVKISEIFFYKLMYCCYMTSEKLSMIYKGTVNQCWKCEKPEG